MTELARRTVRRLGSGWKRTENEKGDFYHRIRRFPPNVMKWRKQFIKAAVDQPELFSAVGSQSNSSELRIRVDQGISWFREVASILGVLYPKQLDCRFSNPIDELVLKVLSHSMGEESAEKAVIDLRSAFGDWDKVLEARAIQIRRAVEKNLPGGAVRQIKSTLSGICAQFDSCTLESLINWENSEAENFLISLPGVAPDDARLVMAAPMGLQVFLADRDRMRVLSRMGPYRDLGLELKRIHHTKRRQVIPDLLPPNLRLSLHQNLGRHAREVCHVKLPDCASCSIKKFCRHYRDSRARISHEQNTVTVVDLFCGAGGMSSGFVRAGCQPALAVDSDPAAMRTYAFNHSQVPDESVLVADIRDVTAKDIRKRIGRRAPDVLVGSPPCQGFSQSGSRSISGKASEFHSVTERKTASGRNSDYRAMADPRNYLFEYMVSLALELRPKLFLMENVPGMNSARMGKTSFFEAAIEQLEEGGYRTDIWRLNAATFGVPQERVRLFLIASRLKAMPARPEHEYRDSTARAYDDYALPPVTFKEATFDLPHLNSNSGSAVTTEKTAALTGSGFKRYLRKFQIKGSSGLIFNHRSRYHNERDLELYELLQPGENSVVAVQRYGRRDLMRYRQDVFDDKYMKLRADRPCRTIVSHLAKDGNGFIHPEQLRSITVREAARLQSFDDEFVFCGSPQDQWTQVGNAVPPLLAEAIARSFMTTLEVR